MAMAMTLPSSTEPKKGTGVTCTGTMELVCGVVQIEDADMNEEPLLNSLTAQAKYFGTIRYKHDSFSTGPFAACFSTKASSTYSS